MYSGSAFVILNAQNLQGIEEKMIWSENVRRPERARESRKEGRVQLTHTHTHKKTGIQNGPFGSFQTLHALFCQLSCV